MNISISGVGETKLYLKSFSKKFPENIIKRLTTDIHKEAIRGASKHTDTGTMENNVAMKIKDDSGAVYIEDTGMMVDWKGKPTNYALFVHFGSRPHKIMPKNKKSLRWTTGSVFKFAKSVDHPGYKGDPFMHNAARKVIKDLDKISKEIYNGTDK